MPVASAASLSANIRALYGPKSTDNLVPLELSFDFEPEKSVLKRLGLLENNLFVFFLNSRANKLSGSFITKDKGHRFRFDLQIFTGLWSNSF
jgi:hypothetical protein